MKKAYLKLPVSLLLRDSDGKKSGFCIENRIALTKAEQEEIGDSQPFMLPEDTYLPTGFTIEDEILANKYIEKMNAKGKKIYLIIRIQIRVKMMLNKLLLTQKKDKCDLKSDIFQWLC